MIGKNEVKTQLLSELAGEFEEHGFKKNVTKQSLMRQFANGQQTIHFGFIAVPEGVKVEPDLAIRLDILEDMIFENTSGYVPEHLRKEKTSFGCFLKKLVPDNDHEWFISKSDDYAPVVSSLSSALLGYGLPFFEKYSDKHSFFDVLLGDDRLANQICSIPINRALNTVGMAFLCGNKGLFVELGNRFLTQLESIPNSRIEVLEEFLTKLKNKMN